jgi:hypothetical protein
MQTAWADPIKKTGILKIFNGTSGNWVGVFKHAVASFNELSKNNGLGVKLEVVGSDAAANVVVKLETAPFPGAVHGNTGLSIDSIAGAVSAEIAVPSNTGDLNLKMMEVVMVHEFFHACGLTGKEEHGSDGVFYSPLSKSGGLMIVPEPKKRDLPMPPMRVDPGTVSKIQSLWSK